MQDNNNSVPKHSIPIDVNGKQTYSVVNGQFAGGEIPVVDTYPNTDCGPVSTHKQKKDMGNSAEDAKAMKRAKTSEV